MKAQDIAIATIHPETATFLKKELKKIFKNKLHINNYSFEDRSIEQGINAKVIIILEEGIIGPLKKYIKVNSEVIIAKRTITKEGYNKLITISNKTKAMLVNVDTEMSMETISLIYKLGINNIELTPAYPGMNKFPDIDLAITPGERRYVPEKVENVIDIGDRVLDISAIYDLAEKVSLEYILGSISAKKYFNKIMPVNFGMTKVMGEKNKLESELDILLQFLDVGIIAINSMGVITSFNKSAEKITGLNKNKVIGSNAKKIFPEIPYDNILENSKSITDEIFEIRNTNLLVSINPIKKGEKSYGAVTIIKTLSETVKQQNRLRAKLLDKGHKADHVFSDIVGSSESIKNAKDIARRMADSDSTVLITGESGTGKELFAQSIHNSSQKRKSQFVAVNCAALPDNLLESELFGYKKGAFTGAKKNGKMGLFELAHQGTLFLDEISEIPYKLQSRLLRVLEQREVMRIGGDDVIKVDVRIIVACNKNLQKLVDKGEFREDLFYRLSILPLKIPPLRKRAGDINDLINTFKKEFKTNFELSETVSSLFLEHKWPGNIRELRNYIEFFANLQKKLIEFDDLPFTFKNHLSKTTYLKPDEKKILQNLKSRINESELNDYIFVLKTLKEKNEKGVSSGRRSIAETANKNDIFITEQEVRKIFKDLEKNDLIIIKKGRGGSKITKKGVNILKTLENKNSKQEGRKTGLNFGRS